VHKGRAPELATAGHPMSAAEEQAPLGITFVGLQQPHMEAS